MFDEFIPKKKIGYLSPLSVIDNGPYEFYRLAPSGVMLVATPVGLGEFSKKDAERVYESVDKLVDILMERSCDIIMMAGVPLPLLMGIDAHDRLLERMAKRAGVPAISHITSIIAALKHLGIRKVAIANKWTDEMNASLEAFFGRADISVAGVASQPLAPKDFVRMNAQDGMELAYELGRTAFDRFPEADGLYIGGGAWLSQPVVERLEQECGRPAVSNQSAFQWDVLSRLGMWKPQSGHGTLMSAA